MVIVNSRSVVLDSVPLTNETLIYIKIKYKN